ncbi:MAG: HAD-IB family hydrolase [Methylovulum sp.]|uniref:histidinol-phosphatase n=1 Tax=Methylovulum sp. TaxID=1916980 RepID=UPI002623FFBC|nr:HAD family hydrolase [Methylovulum sp.]MDD2722396.1 HAD-IB family hydrolase [Methylovulum sp.]MDD5125769.1 HAD-IB family hydrolase [Methylovulum sp.]
MSLAIFDLDNTLIGDDSDYLWGQFLVDQGVVDKDVYEAANAKFYDDYKQGTLDIVEFLGFSLKPLAEHEPAQLYQWRGQFIRDIITPILLKPAQQLIDKHKARGDTLLVITATNRFVTEPIVQLYGIEHLLATTPEMLDGRYTGKFIGAPCFQSGKITHLEAWLQDTEENLQDSWFYSDSHNDLPLLQRVAHPVAVNPDDKLAAFAKTAHWPVISLREADCPTGHFGHWQK